MIGSVFHLLLDVLAAGKVMRPLAMSICLYACETWTITADIDRKIQAQEMRCFCKLLGISHRAVVVYWLLNVPATCECISGMDLLRQFYVLPH